MNEETKEITIDWNRIDRPRSQSLLDRSLSDPSNGLSVSDHHDRRPIIFPPVNHEGLHLTTTRTVSDNEQQPKPKARSSSTRTDFDRIVPHVAAVSDAERCWSRGLHLIGSKFIKIGFIIRSIASRTRLLLKSQSSGGVTPVMTSLLVVLTLFKLWRQWSLRRNDESRDQLKLLIKEKDEKINQLLRQISEMNQVFLGLHKT